MKQSYYIIVLLAISLCIQAQAPQKMSYQAVIRSADFNLVKNTTIGMRISIIQDSIDGKLAYREIQSLSTNDLGLLTTEIGIGVADSGSMDTIMWGKAPHFLKVETDIEGGSNYTITGTSELLSVPYALYAAKADSITMTGISGNLITHDGNNWVAKNLKVDIQNNGGNIAFNNMQPSLVLSYCIALYGVFPSRSSSEPFIGEIQIYPYNFAPRNWAYCDGQLLSIASNTALFSLLGTTYGGDGRTIFGLPDLRGRVAIHQGNGPGLSNRSLGQKSGAETSTLTIQNMPSHNHVVQVSYQ